MEQKLSKFNDYLREEKGMADNSCLAYCQDLQDFARFIQSRGIDRLEDTSNSEVIAYLLQLKSEGKSKATVNRKLASLRAYFHFLVEKQDLRFNPTHSIKSPKIDRKQIEYLTIEEVLTLLSQPDQSIRGIRDKALLELLYASGMRVSEIVGANVSDINLRIGFIVSEGEHGKARIIPLGRPSRAALEAYFSDGRPMLLREKETDSQALFVNYNGDRLTRQGIWKLIKEYAGKAGLEDRLTPKTLRNSFAVHMIQNGADLKSLQELLGHEDITATQVYLSVAKNRIKDVYDKTHPRA
jgi:integrase/recombinase XerD